MVDFNGDFTNYLNNDRLKLNYKKSWIKFNFNTDHNNLLMTNEKIMRITAENWINSE